MSRRPSWGLAACALVLFACGGEQSSSEQAGVTRAPLPEDDRLAWLLEPWPRDSYYGVDTSDPIAILVETLMHGQRDPLRVARRDLALEGEAGVDAARRLIESAWNDPNRFADLRNAMDVLAFSQQPSAYDVIRRVLDHEHPTPRQVAWRALRQHPRPEAYDRILQLLGAESSESRPDLALLLHPLDAERAEGEYLAWIENGEYPELWREFAHLVAESPRARTQERCCSLYADQPALIRLMLAAACARTGDGASLAMLREALRDDKPGLRQMALDALIASELHDEIVWTLESDPSAELRLRAVRALADSPRADEYTELLAAGMSDADDGVAAGCTQALAARDHPGAIERAMQDLSSERPGAVDVAIRNLSGPLASDPELARRALERLLERDELLAQRSLAERRPLLRAIGMIPLTEAAAYLHGLSREVRGRVQGVPAERWLVLQIGNTGDPGQRYLVQLLESESDPLRRLDLIEALAATPTELSREWMLARAEAADVGPYELLFLADRLVRQGPARLVAPVLKRATLRVEQPDVRRALQGLLWSWYPAPRGS